jgi:hypothetical protein
MNFLQKHTPKLAALVVTAGTIGVAGAAMDVTAITAAVTDIAAVGGAVFALIVGTKVFKWIRGAL